jgi:hypothetical protein
MPLILSHDECPDMPIGTLTYGFLGSANKIRGNLPRTVNLGFDGSTDGPSKPTRILPSGALEAVVIVPGTGTEGVCKGENRPVVYPFARCSYL